MSAAASTIARMVVAFDGDNTALKRTFRDSTRDVKMFADAVVVSSGMLKRALGMTGGDLAKAQAFLNAQNRMISAAQVRMDRELSSKIARADPFIAGMAPIGFQMGQTLARTMSQGFAQGNAAGNIQRALTGSLGAVGGGAATGGIRGFLGSSRGQSAALAGVFMLASLGDAAAAGETKLTRFSSAFSMVLKTVSSVALFFGPAGWLVAGITAATSFIVDFFAKTRDEAVRTTKALKEQIDSMIDTGDTDAMLNRVRSLEMGRASAGPSTSARGAFAGGILDLQARLLEEQGRRANFATANVIKRNIAALKAQLAPLLEERARITAAILDPTIGREIRGLPAVSSTALAPGADQFKGIKAHASAVLSLYKTLAGQERLTADVADQVLSVYGQISRALATMPNPFSEQAIALRQIKADLQDAAVVRVLELARGAIPKVGTTPSGLTMEPRSPTVALPQLGFLQTLKAQLGSVFTSLGATIGSTLTATLGAAIGPVALLFRALEPALQILYPLLDKLVAPLAAVLQVIVSGLEPALRLLFPIIRSAAISLSYFSEITARVSAGFAQVIGGLLVGIGNLLNKLPGSLGNPIKRLGQSLLTFADGARKSADDMRAARKRLEGMEWGTTADAVSGLGDAARRATSELLNVPIGYRVALNRFLATTPVNVPTGIPGPTTGGGGRSRPEAAVHFHGPVTIQTAAKNAQQLFAEVANHARHLSQVRHGSTEFAAEQFAYPG